MTIYFSDVFRSLRQEKGITQEQAAERFRVSPQAVSRWECGATMPDIALLPDIADYFGVSIEEILGVEKSKRREKIELLFAEFDEAMRDGRVEECIRIARAGVNEFPNHYGMLNKLMYALFVSGSDDGNIPNWKENREKYKLEIIELGQKILAECTDDRIRIEAKARLVFHYGEIGEFNKGKALAETLPDRLSTREYNLYWVLRGDERLAHTADQIKIDMYHLLWNMHRLIMEDNFSIEERLSFIDKMEQIIHLVFMEDDLGWWYVGIARLYAKTKVPLIIETGNREGAIKLIRQIADYLEQDRKLGDNYQYRSPLLRRTTYEKRGDTADDRTQAEIILEELLTNASYDEIRNEREFVEAVDKIKSVNEKSD